MSILANQQCRRAVDLCLAQVEDRSEVPLEGTSPPVRIRLEKLGPGRWLVRDAQDSRGGLFRDYASAMQFIRHEFAVSQPTVVEMLLA